ncbi:c-type cytochrome [Roseospira navarrensis]|uniref:C-type cytochrome n=1 Tax=Roseospira navarrensis TaxID=140058 RepID=A0A7X1ZHX7_9PROT|nr:c-type cytochrome [Roseospira navarrensis]MQX37936.1 c-type cytochrome [Roseospira navarrensis]
MLKSVMAATGVLLSLGLGATAASAAGDVANGEKLANRFCKACHTFDEGGKHMVGPNLWGVVGREPGAAEGFTRYQAAPLFVQNGVEVWTEELLAEYIENVVTFRDTYGEGKPSAMVMAPLKPEMATDIVAYLATLK